MKKLSILLSFMLASILSFGQGQGVIIVSGKIATSFGSENQEFFGSPAEYNFFSLSAMPMAGVFITDEIAIGGMFELDMSRQTLKGSNSTFSTTQWMVGPVGRFYHHSDVFGEAYVGFGNETGGSFEESIFGWSVGIGRAIFLNEFVAFEPLLRFGSVKHTDKADSNNFRTEIGPALCFSFTMFIE